MTKLCIDKQCRRSGEALPLSEFPKNSKREDGHWLYCSECWNRRMREYRQQRKSINRPTMQHARRKRDVVTKSKDPFVKVYWAIAGGLTTRKAIQHKTQLSYDAIGEVLTVLIWECKAVKIQGREFVLVDPEYHSVAA